MEVVLLERVPHLGQMGSVVKVAAGYARNYLLPKKKALRATKDNLALFEKKRAELEATNLKKKSEAEEVAKRMEGTVLTLIRQAGDSGHLYGSVTSRDIAESLLQKGITIGRTQIHLKAPIKDIGVSTVDLQLHPEVFIPVEVVIAQSQEEAEKQLASHKKGESKTA